MFRFHYLVISAFFVYFLTFLTGCPGLILVEVSPGKQPSATEESQNSASGAEKKGKGEKKGDVKGESILSYDNKNTVNPETAGQPEKESLLIWKPGLLSQVPAQRRALLSFQDPLLESESKPDKLLRNLERSLTGDMMLLALCVFWCLGLLLCLVALYKRHWFYNPMLFIIILPSMVILLSLLFGVRRDMLFLSQKISDPLVLMQTYTECLLFFSGLLLILQRLLPETESLALTELAFMGHLRQDSSSLRSRVYGFIIITIQMTLVLVVALAIANFILLPIYIMQLSFPGFFGLLLIFGLIGLAWFYTSAYYRVSRTHTEESSVVSSTSFLGFRFLRNGLVIVSIVSLVVVVLLSIVAIAYSNINFLQSIKVLEQSGTL